MSVAFFAARRARLQDRNQAPHKTRQSRGIEEALNGRPTSCGKAERYFGDCVSRDGAPLMDSKWMSPSACERYAPLLGPNSSYDEVDPSCAWRQGDGRSKSCQYLCYYDEKYGTSRINHRLWQMAQNGEASLWQQISRHGSVTGDRVEEAMQGFRSYRDVSVPLGRVLEIGCGPSTQTGFLIDQLRKRGDEPGVSHVDLADPGIEAYVRHVHGCAYRDGLLRGYNVSTHAAGGESIRFARATFDTVVSINVLEHCEDAFAYMRKLHRVLKPGGQLIFHERVYDLFWTLFDPLKHRTEVAGLHPLRVKRALVDAFLERYRIEHFSVALTEQMEKRRRTQILEQPMWIIARRKA